MNCVRSNNIKMKSKFSQNTTQVSPLGFHLNHIIRILSHLHGGNV